MEEEKSESDKDKKPQIALIGSGGMGRTAFVKSVIDKWEKEKGIPVKVWDLKDHPQLHSSDILILDDYRSLIPFPPNDLPKLSMKLPEPLFPCTPIKPPADSFEARMKDYTSEWMISSPEKSSNISRGTNKTPKKKKRVKNKRKW